MRSRKYQRTLSSERSEELVRSTNPLGLRGGHDYFYEMFSTWESRVKAGKDLNRAFLFEGYEKSGG